MTQDEAEKLTRELRPEDFQPPDKLLNYVSVEEMRALCDYIFGLRRATVWKIMHKVRIAPISTHGKERLGYPTQKPVAVSLIARSGL